MKNIKSLLFVTFALMLAWPLQAQEEYPRFDAGPNKTILQSVTNANKVQIGLPDTNKDVCYEWRGPNIIDEYGNVGNEGHTPQVWVIPRVDTVLSTYKVVRFSSCGGEQSEVKVFVKDTIAIKYVKDTVECYHQGDTPEIWDFIIETDPANCQTLVKVHPEKVNTTEAFGPFQIYGHDTLDFSLTFNNKTCVYPGPNDDPVVVKVYDDNKTMTAGVDLTDFLDLPMPKCSVNSFMTTLSTLINKCDHFGKHMFDPLKPDEGYKPGQKAKWTLNLHLGVARYKTYQSCCNKTIADAHEMDLGSINFGGTFSGWIGCPGFYWEGLGGLFGEAGIFFGIELVPLSLKSVVPRRPSVESCEEWSAVTFNIEVGGFFYVGAAFVDPSILSFQLGIELKAATQLVLTDPGKMPPLVVSFTAVGKFNLIGFNAWKPTLPLYTYDVTSGKITFFDKK